MRSRKRNANCGKRPGFRMRDSQSLAGRHVLIAEDEYVIASTIARNLEQYGATVSGRVSPIDAARALSERPIDIAILDINLRGHLVFPLVDILRARGVPVVFSTGYDSSVIPPAYADAVYVAKPFTPEQLVKAV